MEMTRVEIEAEIHNIIQGMNYYVIYSFLETLKKKYSVLDNDEDDDE